MGSGGTSLPAYQPSYPTLKRVLYLLLLRSRLLAADNRTLPVEVIFGWSCDIHLPKREHTKMRVRSHLTIQ